jgi:hypothetical protein
MTVRKKREDNKVLSEAEHLLSKAGWLIGKHIIPGCPYHNKNT